MIPTARTISMKSLVSLSILPSLALAGGVINWAPETFPGFLESSESPNQCAGVALRGNATIVSECQKDLGVHPLTRFKKKGNATQEWFVEAVGPKAPYYRFRNHYSNQCVTAVGSLSIQQSQCNDAPQQLWDILQHDTDDTVRIVNSHSGLCLQEEDSALIQAACREEGWKISGTGIHPTPLLPPPSQEIQLRPYFNTRQSDYCVELKDAARITDCDTMPFVRIETVGSYYRILRDSKCLAIAGAQVIGKDCNATDMTQQWEFLVGTELFDWQSEYIESLGAELQGTNAWVRLRNRSNQRCLAAQSISQASAMVHRSCVVTYVAMFWMMTAPPVTHEFVSLQSKRNPLLCAEVRRGRIHPGARLSLNTCNTDAMHQRFSAIARGEYVNLVAGHTISSSVPTCLAVRGGRHATVGSHIIQVKCRPHSKKQQWDIVSKNGTLKHRVTKLCMGLEALDLVQLSCNRTDDAVLWNVMDRLVL